MPTWVVILINGILLAYSVFMLIFGHLKKKKMIEQAKERLKEEMEKDEQNRKATQKDA